MCIIHDRKGNFTFQYGWVYPSNQKIDMANMKRVEDFIRAEIYERLRDHLPYVVKQVS